MYNYNNNKWELDMNKSSLFFIIIILLILDVCVTFFDLSLQVVIIISNIEIILLLFISYKFLVKGFLVALFFNIFNSIMMYLNYLVNDNLVLFQMAFFHAVSILLSGLICILSKKQLNYVKTIEANSYLDTLTEVFNHRYFLERLDTEVSKAKRMNTVIGMIFVDIDNFKGFNETYGHKSGDILLYDTAQVINAMVRNQDIVSRYGSDTFAIILPQISEAEIENIAQNIHQEFKMYIEELTDIRKHRVSISLGYSVYPSIASTKDELISQSDTALYHAKQQGRNNIKIYHDVFIGINQNLNTNEIQLFTSLKTLLGTISAKDRYTLGHSERVMEYAIGIGKNLGLSEERIRILKIAALLHDIGKIEIPQNVLNKKEKLTTEEFALIKKHPIYSAEIIKPLSNLDKLHDIVLHHHERYDGKGYPTGIKGNEIPLEARILTVADSFDAMLSDRPYRKSLSIDNAIIELKQCINTQFDEGVVQAFLRLLERNKKEREIK